MEYTLAEIRNGSGFPKGAKFRMVAPKAVSESKDGHKAIVVRLADSEGRVYRWRIWHVPRAINIISGQPSRVIRGWQYEDHDGYARFSEGSWSDLVAHFKMVADNYGFRLLSELS